ncbi:uncharacterized protein LOC131329333 [Rhododendron vialii]|uniref:uncharacterized protein LOC131329333 n=1 Tax=Rhododendron vialii TaxID=182163 RepID=UPI00265D768A|nr:uncharacterized protein LOC131329333 [Rhododendron vialii]
MVGFLRDPTVDKEHNQQPSELKKSDDPLPVDLSVCELDEFSLSFADSLLDFDCLGDWIEEIPVMDMAGSNPEPEKVGSVKVMEVEAGEGCLGVKKDESCIETGLGGGFQELGDLNASIDGKPFFEMVGLDPGLEKVDSVKMEVKDVEGCVGMEKDGSFRETGLADGFRKVGDLSSSIEEGIGNFSLDRGSEENGRKGLGISVANSLKSVEAVSVIENGVGPKLIVDDDGECKRGETVGINEGGGNSGEMVTGNGDGAKSDEIKSDGEESDSTSVSSSASSSSSSSGSEEEEEKDEDDEEEEEEGKEKEELEGEIDMEEGEIRDPELEQMVGLSDDEDDTVTKGPIRSKNELQVLPPVPPVNVTLQPHHQTQPLGVILSIIGTQVIVEGIEKHNPLSDGSILWITESRSPLGMVDEIFGPVKNPYYMIRYNSESDIPSGIQQGTPISFVPEFANHVLNDCNIYKKGYDASGENDEEVTDEAEFSDDEKEAEYKRMLKMSKRGTNGPNLGNKKKERKKFNNHGGTRQQNSQPSTPQSVEGSQQPPINQNQQLMFNNQIQQFTHDHGNSSRSFGTSQGFAGNPGLVPPFQAPGFIPPSSRVWTNGMPFEQQSMGFPFGVPTNGMPWLQQNQQQQQSYQMAFPNGMPFQQQFNPGQMLPPNVGAQSNFGPGPGFAPWPGCVGQSGLNQALGMGWQAQQSPMSMNVGEQPRPHIPMNTEVPRDFNQGVNRGRGRKPFQRAGGRFGGGRGQRQSK